VRSFYPWTVGEANERKARGRNERQMNDPISIGSSRFRQCGGNRCETISNQARFLGRPGDEPMLIIMLAAAMTIAMLIATAFGLHQEAERVRAENRRNRTNRFGFH
jgi:hypothetical protein